jgi:ribonuclease P protein component
MRLAHARQFDAVYKANVRAASGPLVVWGAPNGVGHPRLGLAVSRRCGGAVVRNRLKRRIREAFRLLQHDLPGGYDLVVSVRAKEALTDAQYRRALAKAVEAIDRRWSTRRQDPQAGR